MLESFFETHSSNLNILEIQITVKRRVEFQETADVGMLVPADSLAEASEDVMLTCLTSFKYQGNKMQVESPPVEVTFRDYLYFSHE